MTDHPRLIYLIGSLRNPVVPAIGTWLRGKGLDIFDDWYSAGQIADDSWRDYEHQRGRHYTSALRAPAAVHVFEFDKHWLDKAAALVLVAPAGKSGHLEFGWGRGQGKPGWVLFPDGEPERWDVMYQFATDVFFDREDLLKVLLHFPGISDANP